MPRLPRILILLAFAISILAACAAPAPTPVSPTPIVAPTAAATASKSSGIITKVTMAEDAQGDNAEPVNPTTVFKPTAIFHAVATISNAKANTKFNAAWYVVDVGAVAPPNTLIDQSELVTEGSRNLDFFLKPVSTWPVGTYRVEVQVNGVLDQVVNFSVK
ncbi:MAG: hypothetical protein HY327_02035 [Chloroflexi bacterium]|nr:hypothetical protein [Chloroflexota bacterium]